MQSVIHFYGGAGTVTGANFLLKPEEGGKGILVDCGLLQGRHMAEEGNWAPFPYDPREIPFLVITHAHIDHIGLIPKLVRGGFNGTIISTKATKALAEPLLMDSMELLAHDALKHGREELYNESDIKRAMSLWEGISYHEARDLGSGYTLEFFDAGHILGSAMARISRGGRSIVFTGDLGSGNSPLLSPREVPPKPEYLLMESVYGDRMHKGGERLEELRRIIEETAKRGGTLLIPAFSTERTQDLVFDIRALMQEKKIPSLPVYVDSPLAEKITAVYLAHPEYFSPAMRERLEKGENIFSFPKFRFVSDAKESSTLSHSKDPKILIAGSGMSNGGRVHGHEKMLLPDKHSTLLIVGYQAAGSLGRRLLEGDKNVFIMGERVRVRARIESLEGYSAHMDSRQLLEFAEEVAGKDTRVFVAMGEWSASGFLAQRIRDYLGVRAVVPEAGERVAIEL